MSETALARHRVQVEEALAAARAAPLSVRATMLAALLLDAHADLLFAAAQAGDRLVFRANLAAAHPALALLFALTALRAEGPRLVIAAVAVPIADYPRLAVEDFMVSLYNDHTIQRVRIAMPDGSSHDAQAVLADAARALLATHPAAFMPR